MVSGLLLAPQCSLDYSEIALQCSPDPAIATFLSVLVFVQKKYQKFVDLKVGVVIVDAYTLSSFFQLERDNSSTLLVACDDL